MVNSHMVFISLENIIYISTFLMQAILNFSAMAVSYALRQKQEVDKEVDKLVVPIWMKLVTPKVEIMASDLD